MAKPSYSTGTVSPTVDALASRKHDKQAQFYAFDMLAGERGHQFAAALTAQSQPRSTAQAHGIFIAEYERGDIGDVLFRVACNMGLEGIVSKHLDRAYGGGRCKHWVKVKNPAHPAYSRVRDALASRSRISRA
jgi:bifunctional non-homologous end joining protein LigD